MTKKLDTFEPDIITQSIEENLYEFTRFWLGENLVGEFYDTSEMIWRTSELNFPLFNITMQVRLTTEQAQTKIKEAIEQSKARKVSIVWWIEPNTQPENLGELLREHRFVDTGELPGMAIDLNTLDTSTFDYGELDIIEVTTDEQLQQAFLADAEHAQVVAEFVKGSQISGYGPQTPLRMFIGYHNGRAVSCSTLFYGAGVAGIYNVATLADARGHGFGTSMTRYALQVAKSDGYRVSILQSSAMALNIYKRLGYETFGNFHIYYWQLPKED